MASRRSLQHESPTWQRSGLPRKDLFGKASGPRDRSCKAGRYAHQNCCENRHGGPGLCRSQIRKLLNDPLVEFIGEIGEHEKQEFLSNAYALMFLIDWQEPFGLVRTEAMACGTPTIAFGLGSVPEIIDEGQTGYIVDSMEEAASAIESVRSLDRQYIRQIFETRFSARSMTEKYVYLYRKKG